MINYNTITGGGVDYDSGPYSVSFSAGNTNVSFDINITIDNLVEDDEEFHLTIDPSSLPTGVNLSSPHLTTVNIIDTKRKFFILIYLFLIHHTAESGCYGYLLSVFLVY